MASDIMMSFCGVLKTQRFFGVLRLDDARRRGNRDHRCLRLGGDVDRTSATPAWWLNEMMSTLFSLISCGCC
jgi:hypothetical protein